jgi:hypothetical protein
VGERRRRCRHRPPQRDDGHGQHSQQRNRNRESDDRRCHRDVGGPGHRGAGDTLKQPDQTGGEQQAERATNRGHDETLGAELSQQPPPIRSECLLHGQIDRASLQPAGHERDQVDDHHQENAHDRQREKRDRRPGGPDHHVVQRHQARAPAGIGRREFRGEP